MATQQNIDFSNVKDGGSFNKRRIPAGDYLATVTKIDDAEAKDKTFQYLVSIKINKHPSSVLPYYCKLQENQLWKLRNLLIAAGLTVPKRRFKVDPNRVVGKIIGVTIEDDEYDGKEQSTIAGVFPAAELGDEAAADDTSDDDGEGEEPEEELGDLEDMGTDTDEDEEEPEAEAEPEAETYADLDRTALKAELKKRNSAFVAKKSQTDDDLRTLLIESDVKPAGNADPIAEEAEDEEEVAPTPAPARKRAAAKPATTVSDDELEELDIDNL